MMSVRMNSRALIDEVAEPARGVDLLGEDEHQPAHGERVAQPGEEPGQRAGQDDVADQLPARPSPNVPADSTSRASTLRIAANVLM